MLKRHIMFCLRNGKLTLDTIYTSALGVRACNNRRLSTFALALKVHSIGRGSHSKSTQRRIGNTADVVQRLR